MKIYNQVGSKERFLEMFQRVNKVQLNEVVLNVPQTGTQLISKAFEELKNKEAKIKQTNTQTEGNDNFVEIITNDNDGNEITFRFKINSNETDQDNVYNVNNAKLVEFKVKSPTYNVDLPENMKAVQDFNANYGNEIMNIVSEYANFETNDVEINDSILPEELKNVYEEAINFIDKIPYRKSTEDMQTNKAYADQKPTNPNLRVKSDELNKFVSEMEDIDNEEDILALPPDYSDTDLSNDDNIKGVDPYDINNNDNDAEEISPEEQEIYLQAYDNLIAAGNQTPTSQQIDAEVLKIKREKGLEKPYEKNRAIPKFAEPFFEQFGNNNVVDINSDELVKQSYKKVLSPQEKMKLIKLADNILTNKLGAKKYEIVPEEYVKIVKNKAIEIYKKNLLGLDNPVGLGLNEKKDGDYPNPIGKSFKPKKQIPDMEKKSQSYVKLSEEEVQIDDIDKLTQDKEEVGDTIPGGKGDNKSSKEFDPEQIKLGLKVEMEHTDNPMVALDIVFDHLSEDFEYYTRKKDPDASAQDGAAKDAEKNEGDNIEITDELLGYKPFNVSDYADENINEKGINGALSEDMKEYQGNIGDRYQDAEGNQLTVKNKDNDSVTFQGQEGEKEIATPDIQYLKKLGENKEVKKEIITEEQIKLARQALNNRGIKNSITKKEAVQLLIKHNIK